jgi:hypothetical protein
MRDLVYGLKEMIRKVNQLIKFVNQRIAIKIDKIKNIQKVYKYIIIYYYKMENLSLTTPKINHLFTPIQQRVLRKKITGQSLNPNEKVYYYGYIKPRISAMKEMLGISDVFIVGKEQMIPERISEGIAILNNLKQLHKSKRIMICGSFLFSKKYNDIDVFIFSKYRKDDIKKKKLHISYFPPEAFEKIGFASAAKISVANFAYPFPSTFSFKDEDYLISFEILINDIQQGYYDPRIFLLDAEWLSSKTILDGKALHLMKDILKKRNPYEILTNKLINSITLGLGGKSIQLLKKRDKEYEDLTKEYPNSKTFVDIYKKAIEFVERCARKDNKNIRQDKIRQPL